MTWKENLVKLYLYICEDKSIQNYLAGMRMSNNHSPEFTDEEVLTIYIFGITEKLYKVKHIYKHVLNHLKDWFPKLPSYQAFDNRLNSLSSCFQLLIDSINLQAWEQLPFLSEKVIDSVPIIVANNKRSSTACVANELCNKGFCSSKNMYYYGAKFHVLGTVRAAQLPLPEKSWMTPAGENDLTAARPVFEGMYNCKIYGDKIYADQNLNQAMQTSQNSIIITPIKKEKGQQFEDAAHNIYSSLVSKVRQPIESLFNWLIEITQIQTANKIRSQQGLLVHVWGKFAAGLLLLTGFFNP